MPNAAAPLTVRRALRFAARLIGAAALAVDAYFHAKLADQYDLVQKSISEGDLFRIEAGLASLAALLLLIWHHPLSEGFAWLVAAGGLAAVLVYRYIDVGTLGPLPNMYEPLWFHDKRLSALSQLVALVMATFLLLSGRGRRVFGVRGPRI
jgi:hypothetical protein